MNNLSKDDLSKLGLGGIIGSNEETQFIDDDKTRHKYIGEMKLDIVNVGTLKNPEPRIVIKEPVGATRYSSDYRLHYLPVERKGFYAEYSHSTPLIGQLSMFLPVDRNFSIEHSAFYNGVVGPVELEYTEKLRTYSQFSFPSGSSNTQRITGFYVNNTGLFTQKVISRDPLKNSFTSGYKYNQSFNFKAWVTGNTSGVSGQDFRGYYIPFPSTAISYQYNAYEIPVKVSNAYIDKVVNSEASMINGLIVITTGQANPRIVYVSPHGLKSGLTEGIFPTGKRLVNPLNKTQTGFTPDYSLYSIKTLSLGSQYNSSLSDVYASGIDFQNVTGDFTGPDSHFVTGITGAYNNYIIGTGQHIRQTEPLKNTLFYKFYTGLYTGIKKMATGTWDGIIPSGVTFQIELITTELNTNVANRCPLYIVYSGYGNNDATDVKFTKYLTPLGSTGQYFLETNVLLSEEVNFSCNGRGFDLNKDRAYVLAHQSAFYSLASKFSNVLKFYIRDVIKQNRKYKKLQKFIKKYI